MVLLLSRKMVRIHKEGKKFLTVLLIVLIIINASVFFFNQSLLVFTSLVSFFTFLFFLQFFRHPKIKKTLDETKVVSPANGKVVFVGVAEETEYFKEKKLQISIFMSPFDVHINRIPISGKISWLKYVPGTFLNASLDKSSEDNERMIIKIEYSKNKYVYVVQIAGLIARRIKCDLSENQSVTIGDRFGLIRFGSRVDLYFPYDCDPLVSEGQTSISGETILADFKLIKSK